MANRVSAYVLEKLAENVKLFAEQDDLKKLVEGKDKKVKKLQNDIDQINQQTFELM